MTPSPAETNLATYDDARLAALYDHDNPPGEDHAFFRQVADEAGAVGNGGHPLGDRLEARRERADRRGGGIEPVADASGRGGLGDGRDGRGLEVAGVGGEVARDQAQEGRLAAAVGADEAGALAWTRPDFA